MKILIIQQKMIGDVLTSGILCSILRKKYPTATLHYLINSHTFPVVEHHPDIDDFIFVTPEIERSNLLFCKLIKRIRKENYDTVIDVYSKLSSTILSFFSGASRKISKYKWYSAFVYTDTYKENLLQNGTAGLAIENRLNLLKPFFNAPIKVEKPKIYLKNEELEHAKHILKHNAVALDKPLFMISVLGSSERKTYPLKYMATLIDLIVAKTDATILFNYIPHQIDMVKHIYNLCSKETQKSIRLDIFGKSLREFIALTKHCTAVIGNEGGAINMAKAIDMPTFSIFSPWIIKEAWNMFDNGTTNDAIHLYDIKPELYKGMSPKQTKDDFASYYDAFLPEFIVPKLTQFLNTIS